MKKKYSQRKDDNTENIVRRLQRGEEVAIDKENRERVVFDLMLQGWARSAIAQLFKMSERNVYRDRAAYLDRCTEHLDPAFFRRSIAQLGAEGDAVISQLFAVANRPDTDPATVVRALRDAMTIRFALLDRFERLGLLERANSHASQSELIEEAKRIGKIAQSTDTDPGGNHSHP